MTRSWMDIDYYFYILSVFSVVYNNILCKQNIFFYFNKWFKKNQVILIVIKIGDLNQADLNRPTLVQIEEKLFGLPLAESCWN